MTSHGDAGGASAVGDRLDATVVEKSAAVEDGARDALVDAHLTEHFTDLLGGFDRFTLPFLFTDHRLDGFTHRTERGDGGLVFVVDDLHVDVLILSLIHI